MKFITGKPEKSGNYAVRRNGEEGRDDYTISGGGHWWNVGNNGGDDSSVEYAPESFRELGL